MLTRADNYDQVYKDMVWNIPDHYNMGVDVCDRIAASTPDKIALIYEDPTGDVSRYSFADIRNLSNKFANLLVAKGLKRLDRFAIILPQSPETAIAHVAAWKAGIISIPMFTLFGEEALLFRLKDSGARALITDRENLPKIDAIRDQLPALELVIIIDSDSATQSAPAHTLHLWTSIENASDTFSPVDTRADDPGLIIYTSGTTGNPKGALHAHRVLLGHQPGVELPHEFLPQHGDLMWTPADWAWIGGLMNILMSSWHHGIPVLAHRARKYDPERALSLMARHNVRNIFMPPTALNLMRSVDRPRERFGVNLRTLTSGGEPMGEELLSWCKQNFGVTPNEYYGQTECNLIVSNCAAIMKVHPGSMGKPVPGHRVEIIDGHGNIMPRGETGDIAVHSPDPVMMHEYWQNPEATGEKFRGDWLLTGDLGHKGEDNYLWFKGRADDVISSAGYRIGPSEIEDCLRKHPAVSLAAAIGVPDPVRTERIKVFIILKKGHQESSELAEKITKHVATKLSAHEAPKEIEFVDTLPMTATGKIKRKDLRDSEKAKDIGNPA